MKIEYILLSSAMLGLLVLSGAILMLWCKQRSLPLRKKNQYGTFLYDPQLQMFKAEINWCCQNAVTAYWCCADHSSESGLRIQQYFEDLMIYSPMWDCKIRSFIVDKIFTIPAYTHDNIRKTLSKTKLYEKLVMDRVAVYPAGMVQFGLKLYHSNDQYYVLVLAYLDGEMQTMDIQQIKECS